MAGPYNPQPNNGRRTAAFYVCSSYHHRGRTVCANRLELRVTDGRERLRESLSRVETELQRLTAAVLAGGEATTLSQAMRDRERQREGLKRELSALERPRQVSADATELRRALRARLSEWRTMLPAQVPQSRQMIRMLMRDRIVFTPNRETRMYRYAIPGSLGRFFSGLACPKELVDAGGIEPPTS